MDKGTYALAVQRNAEGKGRPFIFKVSGLHKGVVTGTLEKYSHIPSKKTSVEVSTKDIILNLGDDPFPGKVHGIDVSELYRGRKTHDQFGPIYWFYKPDEEVGNKLVRAFDKVYKTLKHASLDFLVSTDTCIWEALPYHGEKYAGMYMRSKKPEAMPHRFQIRPEIMPANDWPYVIFHELGHHLHMEYVTSPKLNAAWIRLYNESIQVTSIKGSKSQEFLDGLLAQTENRVSDYKSLLSEEDTVLYKLILRHIQTQHSLSAKELDLLFEAEYYDDIRNVWPTRGISKKDLAPIVTSYACKNVKELFAESFAFYMTNKKLPKNVIALLEKSISYAKVNREK
jgi:hypothetical protein